MRRKQPVSARAPRGCSRASSASSRCRCRRADLDLRHPHVGRPAAVDAGALPVLRPVHAALAARRRRPPRGSTGAAASTASRCCSTASATRPSRSTAATSSAATTSPSRCGRCATPATRRSRSSSSPSTCAPAPAPACRAKPVLITFDDSRTEAMLQADPILAATGMRAVMFVSGGHASSGSLFAEQWEQPRGLSRSSGRWELENRTNDLSAAHPRRVASLDPARGVALERDDAPRTRIASRPTSSRRKGSSRATAPATRSRSPTRTATGASTPGRGSPRRCARSSATGSGLRSTRISSRAGAPRSRATTASTSTGSR